MVVLLCVPSFMIGLSYSGSSVTYYSRLTMCPYLHVKVVLLCVLSFPAPSLQAGARVQVGNDLHPIPGEFMEDEMAWDDMTWHAMA